jgi:hypothetical protein
MNDRAAERCQLGLLFINMDELVVACCVSEHVHLVLSHLDPFTGANVFADLCCQILWGHGTLLLNSYVAGKTRPHVAIYMAHQRQERNELSVNVNLPLRNRASKHRFPALQAPIETPLAALAGYLP